MSRPINPNRKYTALCRVTATQSTVNPHQCQANANRYGISLDEYMGSYVSRIGKATIREAGLNADEITAKYGIHPAIAASIPPIVYIPRARILKVKTPKVTPLVPTNISLVPTNISLVPPNISYVDQAPPYVEYEAKEECENTPTVVH